MHRRTPASESGREQENSASRQSSALLTENRNSRIELTPNEWVAKLLSCGTMKIGRTIVLAFFVGLVMRGDASARQYVGRSGTPFGPIAALAGWYDLATARDSESVEIRISCWFCAELAPVIRVMQLNDSARAEVLLWWPSGNREPSLPWPSGPEVHCDALIRGPQTCVKSVAVGGNRDWTALVRDVLVLGTCEPERTRSASGLAPPPQVRSPHEPVMQWQISDKGRFREVRCYPDGKAGSERSRTFQLLQEIAASAGR